MQLELFIGSEQAGSPDEAWLKVGAQHVRLRLARNRRARRYILRLCSDGAARVTVPWGGSAAQARRFAQRNVVWLAKQLLRRAARPMLPAAWMPGTVILLRGENVILESTQEGQVRLGTDVVNVLDAGAGLRPAIETYLRRLAVEELPQRALELAALHQFQVRRVSVRNQRSRWGSCSRLGTVSLNWRLVQTPAFVRDYIILHELAHLKHMNHSRRFWDEVERLCPEFRQAERWLKQHTELLR